jgi:hypothetical protein
MFAWPAMTGCLAVGVAHLISGVRRWFERLLRQGNIHHPKPHVLDLVESWCPWRMVVGMGVSGCTA